MHRFTLSGSAIIALLLLPVAALAWPNGPDEDPRLDPPNDPGFGGQWNLWSYVPEEWAQNPGFRTTEATGADGIIGTGIHADRAWQVTPGDRSVIIAVLDSGVYWDNRDLVNKYYLNRDELANCKPTALATPPAGADDFDVDGSGWFDIRDYYAASGDENAELANWDENGNGMLDPQDLILKCSDGVDDDANGYLDDISGWDFFRDDNDAYDDNRFGHGNGEARDSAAEGNNGIGDIGVCPGCTALMVRVGDSFVADANDFAQGVVFGVDSGAAVIQEALGTVNNTPFSQDAINYAYDNNSIIIASAADELSFHHNMPGTNNHTLYVHAIQFDTANATQATTFLNFNNCTNFGMQLLLSTPGTGCSSEAVGISAGHAGLIYSAALIANNGGPLDPPLSAEEAKQVFVHSADDINVPESSTDLTKFPSGPGWDFHFGYGRNNARTSVDMIMEGRIPPEVDIVSPLWFQVIYPDRTPSIELTGRINKRRDGLPARYTSVDWKIEYAVGTVPQPSDWVEIASGSGEGVEGVLANWDVSSVPVDLDATRSDPHQTAVTVRLSATATLPDGTTTVTGDHRKGFIFDRDPDLHAAFPINLGGSGESSPVFANIDGADNDEELVVALADGSVHAFQADGTEVAGFPVWADVRRGNRSTFPAHNRNSCAFITDKANCDHKIGSINPDVHETMMMAPAVGDLDGDGTLEIVLATWDGSVYVWNNDGSRRAGFPVTIQRQGLNDPAFILERDYVVDDGFFAAPTLVDLDGQPGLEILAAGQDGKLHVWHNDGTIMAPYPVTVDFECLGGLDCTNDPMLSDSDRIITTPAVGDIDGDGDMEIAIGTSEVFGPSGGTNEAIVYVVDAQTGMIVAPDWPQSVYGLMVDVLPIVGRGVVTNPLMADLDFDGTLEISFDTISTPGIIFNHDGSEYRRMNNLEAGAGSDTADLPAYVLMNNGAMGYIDPEGGIDFVKGTAGFDFALAFAGGGILPDKRQPNGNVFDHHISGWDTDTGEPLQGFPRVMDDWQFFNTPAIVDLDNDADPEVVIGSGGYLVHAFNYKGEEPAGWPKQTGGWIIASAAVGDIDGDGLFDVAISTRNGWLYVWKTQGDVQNLFEWNGFGANPHNTNNYEDDPTPYQTWEDKVVTQPDPEPDAGPEQTVEASEDTGTAPETDTGTTPGEPKDEDGCASGNNGLPTAPLALLVLMVAVVVRRRLV